MRERVRVHGLNIRVLFLVAGFVGYIVGPGLIRNVLATMTVQRRGTMAVWIMVVVIVMRI